MPQKKLPPIHPGEILSLEFLKPLKISPRRLARETRIPLQKVSGVINGKRRFDAGMALRLARYLGTSERFWLNLQTHFDLEMEKDRLGEKLAKVIAFDRKNGS